MLLSNESNIFLRSVLVSRTPWLISLKQVRRCVRQVWRSCQRFCPPRRCSCRTRTLRSKRWLIWSQAALMGTWRQSGTLCVCVCGSLTQRCFIYHIGSFTYCSDSTLFSSLLISVSLLSLSRSLPPLSHHNTTPNSYALISYNVKRDDLDFAVQITPGLSSPTVQPLAPIKGVKWCSVSAMVARKEVGVAMDKLKALGRVRPQLHSAP